MYLLTLFKRFVFLQNNDHHICKYDLQKRENNNILKVPILDKSTLSESFKILP